MLPTPLRVKAHEAEAQHAGLLQYQLQLKQLWRLSATWEFLQSRAPHDKCWVYWHHVQPKGCQGSPFFLLGPASKTTTTTQIETGWFEMGDLVLNRELAI